MYSKLFFEQFINLYKDLKGNARTVSCYWGKLKRKPNVTYQIYFSKPPGFYAKNYNH